MNGSFYLLGSGWMMAGFGFWFDIPNSISFENFLAEKLIKENLTDMKLNKGGDLRDLYILHLMMKLYEYAACASN